MKRSLMATTTPPPTPPPPPPSPHLPLGVLDVSRGVLMKRWHRLAVLGSRLAGSLPLRGSLSSWGGRARYLAEGMGFCV